MGHGTGRAGAMKNDWKIWRRRSAGVAGLAAIALGAALLTPCTRADDSGSAARAARLSSVDGKVQVLQGDQVLADPAVANTPLFEGTRIATADGGQAEIQFDDGSVARLSPNSSLTLSVLRGADSSGQTEMVLEGGLGYFEVQAVSGGQTRVRFADGVVTVSGFTVLRINLDNLPGQLAVFTGNAHLERSGLTLDLHGGQSVALNGADPSQYKLSETIEPDSWDAWNADRDQALQAEYGNQTGATKSFSDSNNPAWADLDTNGNWYNVPGQGYVWSPNDASNPEWDPYGNGYWMWTPRFGYIWVSGDSWGYMPYSCGNWNYFDEFGWGWAPGGMCRPWWGYGGGWGYNVGRGPGGYRPPRRPVSGPGAPHRLNPDQTNAGNRPMPHPIIPVSRRLSGISGSLPARNRNVPVVIGGHPVRPDAPVSLRPVYPGTGSGFANRPQPIYNGGTRVPAEPRQPGNPGFVPSRPTNQPTPRAVDNGNYRPAPSPRPVAPPSRPSGGGVAPPSRPSGGGGSHPSGGGGGGSRGGGGGGGGGGSRGGGGHH